MVVMLLWLASGLYFTAHAAQTAPDPSGRWVSASCETRSAGDGSKRYVKRDASFNARTSTLKLDIFTDPACSAPALSFVFEGPYRLVQPSTAVPSATEAEFVFATVKLTPRNDALVALFNSAAPGNCGSQPWQLNREQEITSTGCAPIGVNFKDCAQEYDLLKVEGDKLYYGERPSDGSSPCTPERRPTALQVPLVRAANPAPAAPAQLPNTGINTSQWLLLLGSGIALGCGLALRRRAGRTA
jgi:LPXTG-motif cell wall-anchored protein